MTYCMRLNKFNRLFVVKARCAYCFGIVFRTCLTSCPIIPMSAETNTARSPESSSNTKALEWVTIGNVLVVAFDNLKKVFICGTSLL